MFIELTDHLRCLAGHQEAYLVLLPGEMEGRVVRAGHLGCPVCGWSTEFSGGLVDFGGETPPDAATRLTAEAVHVLLGLSGPGGYVALVGAAGGLAMELEARLPGIGLVAVNPPASVHATAVTSVLRGGALPLKTSSMRGVVLGAGPAGDPEWTAAAVRATLPGLRVVGEGNPPKMADLTILGMADGVWVGRKGK